MALSDEINTYSKGFRWDLSDPKQKLAKNAEDSAQTKWKKAAKRVHKLEK